MSEWKTGPPRRGTTVLCRRESTPPSSAAVPALLLRRAVIDGEREIEVAPMLGSRNMFLSTETAGMPDIEGRAGRVRGETVAEFPADSPLGLWPHGPDGVSAGRPGPPPMTLP